MDATLPVQVDVKSSGPAEEDAQPLAIGALAARFGLATHVLRHWESMGLLAPTRDAAGRRVYGAGDVVRTAVILRAKEAGLSLDAIRAMLTTGGDPAARRTLLRDRATALRAEIARAERRLELVECALECTHPDLGACPHFRRSVDDLLTPAAGR